MDSQATYKKLAEVAALVDMLGEINTRSKKTLFRTVLDIPALNSLTRHSLTKIVPLEFAQAYGEKYDRTTSKLTDMVETYIGEKWEDPIELSEWCGFHLGAGLVHASLVENNLPDHAEMLSDITESFQDLLLHVSQNIPVLAKQ